MIMLSVRASLIVGSRACPWPDYPLWLTFCEGFFLRR